MKDAIHDVKLQIWQAINCANGPRLWQQEYENVKQSYSYVQVELIDFSQIR